jgi:hypothetical protein
MLRRRAAPLTVAALLLTAALILPHSDYGGAYGRWTPPQLRFFGVTPPSTDSERLSFYQDHIPDFVGGYTVAGTSMAQGGSSDNPALTSFSVAQECLCEVAGTAHGIYAKGANEDNAFSLIAAVEPDGSWHAQQVSVGATPSYQATMRFGTTAGGKHSAVGFFLNPKDGGEQTTFRAEQSAIGCTEGIGATACERVCQNQGLSYSQISDKCWAPLGSLDHVFLTDWARTHADGTRRSSVALFSEDGARIKLFGSDDGVHFWTLYGERTGDSGSASATLVVDFAPKGGPANLPGVWFGDRIEWQDGNVWKADAPPCAIEALRAHRKAPRCWDLEKTTP